MTSFQTGLKPSRRAAARFIARVRRTLVKAIAAQSADGMTQSEIARRIDVHRSLISRELNGRGDITLGRIAEIAWALDSEIKFDLVRQDRQQGLNVPTTLSAETPWHQAGEAPGSYANPSFVGKFETTAASA